jgi:hypothetical protein
VNEAYAVEFDNPRSHKRTPRFGSLQSAKEYLPNFWILRKGTSNNESENETENEDKNETENEDKTGNKNETEHENEDKTGNGEIVGCAHAKVIGDVVKIGPVAVKVGYQVKNKIRSLKIKFLGKVWLGLGKVRLG